MMRLTNILSILMLLLASNVYCQSEEQFQYKLIGKIQPKHSSEIVASNWSIGGETLDRDFTDFHEWKEYLGPLGAKKIRLQAGWAKCEKEKGVYDFDWLDEVIDGVIQQGVEPWLQTSYGNPIYEGGGNAFLSGGFPTSPEALAAWDNWVLQLAKRYKGRVKIWEIWNESDLNSANTPELYAKLFVRTAEIIKSEIPDATIYALSLANPRKTEYVKSFLDYLKDHEKLDLVDAITVHGYTYRPEDIYQPYYKLLQLVYSYSEEISLIQGELGCPSENQSHYALRNYPWTENAQSKWLLRKMMGDLGHDIPSLYFTIIDMNYIKRYKREDGKVTEIKKGISTVNTKGLIKANKDNTVDYLKPAYYAYQNITSIFDHRLKRIPNFQYETKTDSSVSVYGYRMKNFDYLAIAIWIDSNVPSDSNNKIGTDLEFPSGNFDEPVYVDMRTGEVFEFTESDWENKDTGSRFKNIPIYDSPILIVEKELVNYKK